MLINPILQSHLGMERVFTVIESSGMITTGKVVGYSRGYVNGEDWIKEPTIELLITKDVNYSVVRKICYSYTVALKDIIEISWE